MTAIIRVKRHFQDDPVEAIRLECKRRKTEQAGDTTSFEKVLNFVGTVNEKDDFVSQRTLGIPSFYQRKVKQPKKRIPDVLAKARKEMKSRVEESRFKIISCMRSRNKGDELDSTNEEVPKEVTIVDVNLEKSNGTTDENSKNNYVYDLYSANLGNEDYDDLYFDNVVGIEPYISDGVFDLTYRDPEDYADEDFDPDEDDSNDENNWRNFYPDEEESDSEEIDVLTNDFQKFGTGDFYELSSDDGEEKYANYIDKSDKSEYYYHEAKDLGGSLYAKYKMKVLNSYKTNENFIDDGDEDEDEDEDEETY